MKTIQLILALMVIEAGNSSSKRNVSTKLLKKDNLPTVQIRNGMTVIGRINKTAENTTYYTYRAIPFAIPPVEELRFKAPVPLRGNFSKRIVNASDDAYDCFQSESSMVSEDCLYLNVYSPQQYKSSFRLPVMVWIYGGTFIEGSSRYSLYGPDYLLNKDVIVVTFNYRLGIFGFLSTGDAASPGNYGLKDQILALEWVQENIEYFGGDSNRVTIFGESAGAYSVSFLSLTPLTKGLFHGVILESGTALNSRAFTRNGSETALITASILNVNIRTSETLVNGLRKIDARTLHKAATIANLREYVVGNPMNGLPIGPTLEPEHPGAVITNYSYEQLQNGNFHKVPYIIGFNSLEGIPYVDLLNNIRLYLLKCDITPTELVPASLNIYDPEVKLIVAYIIKAYYFGITPVVLSEQKLLEYVSDGMFVRPILKAALLYAQQTPVYLYKFSYQGPLGSGHRKQPGVGHAEELPYLWKMLRNHEDPTPDDLITRERLVALWTNFAKYGNPTPFMDSQLQNVNWPLANVNHKFNLKYLNIDKTLTVSANPNWKSFLFWTDLFKMYGNPPFNTY